ncbi:hypothetical protein ABIB81_008269 [Bradyrhizobium sp. I1.7.5]
MVKALHHLGVVDRSRLAGAEVDTAINNAYRDDSAVIDRHFARHNLLHFINEDRSDRDRIDAVVGGCSMRHSTADGQLELAVGLVTAPS